MAGGGGSEPNLTPFIDLFSVLVCFLLMTAAWLQLESVAVQVEKPPANSASEQEPPPQDKNDEAKVKLSVFLYKDRIGMNENGAEQFFTHLANGFDIKKLKGLLAEWRIRYPKKKDIILNTEARVTYGDMIKLYDTIVGSDWTDVGINPN